MELHGFLNVDKPLGWTSHDVVGRLRRILGTKKVGHAGTLDPAATGVLVVGVGRATRFLDYVQNGAKTYVAHVVLGVASETADIDGRLLEDAQESAELITRERIEAILPEFHGEIEQVPPKYSALKQDGEPLYRKMRRGELVDVPTRTVRVDSLRVLSFRHPDLVLEIHCGSGVYVRSLAQDIGERLGTAGYLHHLLRTQVGSFGLTSSLTLPVLEAAHFPECWTLYATSIDSGLRSNPALLLDDSQREAWYHGRSIRASATPEVDILAPVRAFTEDGNLGGLAIAEIDETTERYRPKLVLPAK